MMLLKTIKCDFNRLYCKSRQRTSDSINANLPISQQAGPVRLTDRPDMTLDVYRGRKTTKQSKAIS